MATPKVLGVFLRQREYGIDWPGARYDIEGGIQDYTEKLLKIGEELGVQIECKEPFYDSKDVAKLTDEEKEQPSDGIVVIGLSMRKWDLANEIVEMGKPTIIFTPFCGFTKQIAELSRKKGVYLNCTLDFDSVKYGIKMINGVYEIWEISRDNSVTFRLTHVSGVNSMVLGFFVTGPEAVAPADKLTCTWGNIKRAEAALCR